MSGVLRISDSDAAYGIIARKLVWAINNGRLPTVEDYHAALVQCLKDQERLRLTAKERQAIAWVCGDVADITGPIEDTLRGLLERTK